MAQIDAQLDVLYDQRHNISAQTKLSDELHRLAGVIEDYAARVVVFLDELIKVLGCFFEFPIDSLIVCISSPRK